MKNQNINLFAEFKYGKTLFSKQNNKFNESKLLSVLPFWEERDVGALRNMRAPKSRNHISIGNMILRARFIWKSGDILYSINKQEIK